jgi:hypothetical protein
MRRGRGAHLAALVGAIVIAAALPSATTANPTSASATLSVGNANGQAAELLHRLTIPQLAAALKTTPAQLTMSTEPPSGSLHAEVGELTSNPASTLEEVLGVLASHGVSTAPLQDAINRLLAGGTPSGEQLSSTINSVLALLREGGQLGAVANELGLPPAALEAANLAPSTLERAAGSLGASTARFSSVLARAGAATQSLTAGTPLASAPVPSILAGGQTLLVGVPTGSGGLSLTTVNSTAAGPSATSAGSATPISNAFSIVSIKVGKGGTISETVKLPGPGRVAIVASAPKKVALRSRSGHKRSFTRRATLASLASGVSGGVHTLTLHARGLAGGASRLVVTLATTYTPTGGSPNTLRRNVTVRRAAGKRHH